jgi:hypothetical protein
MIGFNGGLIGKTRSTSAQLSVPGVWTAREQLEGKRNFIWPSLDGDPNYQSVSLLLHGDGANNSATFADNSPRVKTPSAVNGNTKISTTESKFNGASIAFDGNGDTLAYASTSDFLFGVGNFTIEFWAWFNSTSSTQALTRQHGQTDQYQWSIYMPSTATVAYYLSSTGDTWNVASGVSFGTITTNNWIHVALVRNGSTFTPYLNGVPGTTTTSSASLFATTSALLLGGGIGGDWFNGFIDDYRITKGVARYTANFSSALPPLPFPNF